MSVGASANEALPTSLAIATLRKQHDAIKAEGNGALKLLEGAAQIARSANQDPDKGRIVDLHA